jgi:hypothetical protein
MCRWRFNALVDQIDGELQVPRACVARLALLKIQSKNLTRAVVVFAPRGFVRTPEWIWTGEMVGDSDPGAAKA